MWLTRIGAFGRVLLFGPSGNATSVANEYHLSGQDVFLANPETLTTHNSLLQQPFDGGLIGTAFLLAALVVTVLRFSREPGRLPELILILILILLLLLILILILILIAALCFDGTTEIVLAPGATQAPFFVLLAFAAFATTRPTPPRDVRGSRTRALVARVG